MKKPSRRRVLSIVLLSCLLAGGGVAFRIHAERSHSQECDRVDRASVKLLTKATGFRDKAIALQGQEFPTPEDQTAIDIDFQQFRFNARAGAHSMLARKDCLSSADIGKAEAFLDQINSESP